MPSRKYQYQAATPQTGEIFFRPDGSDHAPLYTVEQFIIDLRSRNRNTRENLEEWLGWIEPIKIPANHAQCSSCHRILSFMAFHEDDRKTNGRYSRCKECHNYARREARRAA